MNLTPENYAEICKQSAFISALVSGFSFAFLSALLVSHIKNRIPVIALRYVSGEFCITLQTGPNQTILFSQKESILNQWLAIAFQIHNNHGYKTDYYDSILDFIWII
jgi:hypothetical protein